MSSFFDTPFRMVVAAVLIMVHNVWKQECSSLQMQNCRPEHFVLCYWQKTSIVHPAYVIYRSTLAALFITIMMCSFFDVGRDSNFGVPYVKWGIYLTNWGFTICTLQALLAAYHTVDQFIKLKKQENTVHNSQKLSVSYQIYWILHSLAIVLALGITIGYWTAVYNPEHTLDALNVLVHAFNSLIMVADFLLISHPFIMQHCCWSLLFIISYIVFSYIYYLCGGTDRHNNHYIYSHLDWSVPLKAILASVCGLLLIFLIHFSLWLIFLLKRWVGTVINKGKEHHFGENGNVQVSFSTNDVI